jgi:type VI secretion system protein VasD
MTDSWERSVLRRGVRVGFACLAPIVVSGCLASVVEGLASVTLDQIMKPSPTEMEVQLSATNDVNPDPDGKASPIVVRVYELKTLAAFDNQGFFDLYDNDTDLLGDDLQVRDEFDLSPEETISFERELKEGSRFIAVIAAYQDLDNATWRASAELPPNETTKLFIEVGRLEVKISVDE